MCLGADTGGKGTVSERAVEDTGPSSDPISGELCDGRAYGRDGFKGIYEEASRQA